jgi:transcriptional regulator with XRE-family HTH domain
MQEITAAQCRAGRALLDWSQQQLADAARVGVATVRQFEGSGAAPRKATVDAISRALDAAGVLFIDQNGNGAGVRLRDRTPEAGLEAKIADATERVGRPIPEGASPASGMAKLRRGHAEIDLRSLKEKRRRLQSKRDSTDD